VAPGNHHDSLFLTQIISLAKAIGLEVDIMLGDEAYGDGPDSEEIRPNHRGEGSHSPSVSGRYSGKC
jgi:hypothetical protein